ncbi:P53 inducible protein [Echinococcus multilocularis]|uniref:Cytoplasmic FMR1-interacting protein n=1 Tax=Echinococcus multilocularis TaxID=6211 RepID=A0A068Y839_ECHMU|nr:P53 inducible protein [Echinococcus multilocularis]
MTSIDADQKHTHQIGDAFRKVHDLVNIPLSEDVPTIQAANFSVLYQANTDTNFGDIFAFKSAFAGSYEDAMVYAELQDLYNQGQDLSQIDGFEDILAEIINSSVSMYESRVYVLPEEKHTLVMVIAFSLYLLDSSKVVEGKQIGVTIPKMSKKISISKIDRIFKECEVVNLFGDMSVEPFNYVKQTLSYDPSKWPECTGIRVSSQGVLLTHMTRFVNEYTSLTADLAWHTNIAVTRTSERSVAENRELYDLALRGLQCLSSWSVQVLDTFTWKLAHCADEHTNRECPKDAENYERATRYNYTSEERCALIRLITMIKSVQTQLLRLETNYSEAIRRSVYLDLHGLLNHFRNLLIKASSKKKEKIKLNRLVHALQATCADQAVVDAVEADLLMTGSSNSVGKSGWGGRPVSAKASAQNSLTSGSNSTLAKAAESMVGTPVRRVGPSSTQLYLVRTMLELMIDQASPAAKYHSLRKELDSNTMAAIETFLKNSFYWPYLLNFSETLVKCCDLSQLWYREFFLEIANGTRIQFPIEMSLPWILTDHILETRDPALMESLLYPLDLYNDAADCALNRFHRRFFFDEIEAEANLVFDQLVYKLSDQLFRYYKQYAASILLDKKFRLEAQRAGWREPYPQPNRYAAALIRQRSVQLLGRSIDLSYLLSQRINRAIAKSLEEAIQRFLCSDITAVVELEALIECNRLCHRMLAEHLELDDFDGMLQEANNLVTSPLSKIAFHVFWEVTWDLVKNYCYNGSTNRFVQTKFALAETLEREKPSLCAPEYLWGSKSLNSCYEAIFQLSRGFIGAPHFSAICRLLGYQGIFIIFTEIMKFCKSLVNQTIKEYVRRIASMMPKSVSLPSPTANSGSQYGLYANALQRVYQYSDLRTNVCQNFREFGNIIIFCLQMEKRLTTEDLGDLKHADAFIRKPASSTGERPISDSKMRDSSNQIDGLNIYKVASAVGSSELAELADGNEVLTRERLCCGLVLFEQLLNRIREFLNEEEPQTGAANGTARQMPRNVWYGSEASGTTVDTDELIEIEGCTQFHRVWSAIQFVFSTPFGENEYTVEEMFGEGLNWAGCTLITLLGQQRRFEMLDFGAHFVKLQRSDKLDTCKDGVCLARLATRLSRFNVLNRQIFATLNNHLHPIDRAEDRANVRHFPPPQWPLRLHGKTAASSPFPSSTLVLLIPPPIPMCTRMLRVIAVVPSLVLPKNHGTFAFLPKFFCMIFTTYSMTIVSQLVNTDFLPLICTHDYALNFSNVKC